MGNSCSLQFLYCMLMLTILHVTIMRSGKQLLAAARVHVDPPSACPPLYLCGSLVPPAHSTQLQEMSSTSTLRWISIFRYLVPKPHYRTQS